MPRACAACLNVVCCTKHVFFYDYFIMYYLSITHIRHISSFKIYNRYFVRQLVILKIIQQAIYL